MLDRRLDVQPDETPIVGKDTHRRNSLRIPALEVTRTQPPGSVCTCNSEANPGGALYRTGSSVSTFLARPPARLGWVMSAPYVIKVNVVRGSDAGDVSSSDPVRPERRHGPAGAFEL